MKYIIESSEALTLTKYHELPPIEPPEPVRPTGKIIPGFNFTWEEVLNEKDTDWVEYLNFIHYIVLLASMLQEYRGLLARSISIESWFRSTWYNDINLPSRGYASSKTSDHKQGRAADTNVTVSNHNIELWKQVCRRHGVFWSIGLYNWGMHLGFRFDKNKQWDYRK